MLSKCKKIIFGLAFKLVIVIISHRFPHQTTVLTAFHAIPEANAPKNGGKTIKIALQFGFLCLQFEIICPPCFFKKILEEIVVS
jgi:hypothetical protein